MLKHATTRDLIRIYNHFRDNKQWFPHVRRDYIERMIRAQNVIFQDGVIIIYKRYQRRNKIGSENTVASAGDIILHQILNTRPRSGAATKILTKFFNEMRTPVWLTVRASNRHAIHFYLKNKMKRVGKTSWMNGSMPGLVFRYEGKNRT